MHYVSYPLGKEGLHQLIILPSPYLANPSEPEPPVRRIGINLFPFGVLSLLTSDTP